MANIILGHGAGKLHLDRDDAVVGALHDQIVLMLPAVCPQVTSSRLCDLGVHPDAKRHQRLLGPPATT